MSATAKVCWSLDCASHVLIDNRRFRTLNVFATYKRHLLSVETNFWLPTSDVIQALTRYVHPMQLCTNNGLEFINLRLISARRRALYCTEFR